MSNAVDAARSGMIQHERNLEAIANNLANINTPGYKRVVVHFQDLLTSDAALDVLFAGEAVASSSGVSVDTVTRQFSAGAIVPSDVPTAMAIAGEGFFVVLLEDGSTAYTRDGTFGWDAEGYLATVNGYRVQPPIQNQGAAGDVQVSAEGIVTARSGRDDPPEDLGRIQLALVADPTQFEAIGQNLYRATAESGEPQLLEPGTDGAGEIVGQALESSNVEIATELTNLIAAQRAYQFNLAAFQTADEMMRQINEAMQV